MLVHCHSMLLYYYMGEIPQKSMYFGFINVFGDQFFWIYNENPSFKDM